MQPHSRRYRVLVLLATVLASAVVPGIPFTGLAQTPPTPDRSLPSDKRAPLAREARDIAAAQAAPRPPKDVAKPPRLQSQPLPVPTRPDSPTASSPLLQKRAGAGTIVESGLAPFPGSLYAFENRWYEPAGAADLVVYAGAARVDSTRGLVAVRLVGISPGAAAIYHTPIAAGAVRVVAAEGERLTLVSTSGARFVFDVASRSFIP